METPTSEFLIAVDNFLDYVRSHTDNNEMLRASNDMGISRTKFARALKREPAVDSLVVPNDFVEKSDTEIPLKSTVVSTPLGPLTMKSIPPESSPEPPSSSTTGKAASIKKPIAKK